MNYFEFDPGLLYIYFDLFILFMMSIFTFAIYGWDKHLAVYDKRRVPEIVLLALTFLGGAFGALCGMIFFRHKTLHKAFLICVPLFLAFQLSADILYRIFIIAM